MENVMIACLLYRGERSMSARPIASGGRDDKDTAAGHQHAMHQHAMDARGLPAADDEYRGVDEWTDDLGRIGR